MTEIDRATIDACVSKRVTAVCRASRIMAPKRITLFSHTVADAVQQLLGGPDGAATPLEQLVDQQARLLKEALGTVKKRVAAERAEQRARARAEQQAAEAGQDATTGQGAGADDTLTGKSLEEKLAESRAPLRQLLREDCVQLGLVTPERAGELAIHLAGKTPQKAEREIIEELRNNLHRQVKAIIRELKGGPWGSVKQQEGLRLDIAATNSIKSVLALTRQLLAERDKWEQENQSGFLGGLMRGRIRFSLGKK